MLDLKKIEEGIDRWLATQTPQSLLELLLKHRLEKQLRRLGKGAVVDILEAENGTMSKEEASVVEMPKSATQDMEFDYSTAA